MQGFLFSALFLQKEVIEADIFSNWLTANLRPVNCRPEFGRNEAFLEDVVGNLGQTIKIMFLQFKALQGGLVAMMTVMATNIDVFKPEAGWYVIFKVKLVTPEPKQLDTGNAHRRRESKRSLESRQRPPRGVPRLCNLV